MAATRPLLRLTTIDHAIAAAQYPSLARLADQCAVTTRTIKRDLQALRSDFGAPLAFSRIHQGYHYTQPFSLGTPPLAEGELLALCMLSALAGAFHGTPFDAAIRGAISKLRLLLPDPIQAAYGADGPIVCCLPDPAPEARPEFAVYFRQLFEAIRLHRQVRITYHSMYRDEERTRVVDPHRIYQHRGMWYLHSWCHLRGEHRDFALPRIQALTVLALTFTPPSSAEVDARLAMRFSGVAGEAMDVAVLFDPAEARRIRERLWHPSQRIDDHPDGTCTLFLHTEGLPTLVRWVLSFGSHARVLAPPELAEAVWAEVKAMEAALREFGLGNNAQVH